MELRIRMPSTWVLVAVVMCGACMACGTSDRPRAESQPGSAAPPVAPQTAKQAMELVCAGFEPSGVAKAPVAQQAQVMSAWMRTQVTNPEILRVIDELALDTWSSARTRLVTLATAVGVTDCKLAETVSDKPLHVDVPELAGPAERDADHDPPLVIVAPAQITLDGAPVVTLDKGRLAPADRKGQVLPPLAAWRKQAPSTARVRIAFDRTIPVETVIAVIRSLGTGKQSEVALVCMQNHEQVVLPVDMPLGAVDVSYAVTAGKDALTLAPWKKGKAEAPIVTATLDGGLGQILRGLAERANGTAAGAKIPVLLIVDPSHDVNRLVGLLGGLRSMPTHVVLSRGSE